MREELIYAKASVSVLRRCSAVELLSTQSASLDLIVTDPPYGTNYCSNSQGVDRKHRNRTNQSVVVRQPFFKPIKGDDKVPTDWLIPAFKALNTGGAIYIFANWQTFGELQRAVNLAGFKCKNMIVINKSNHGMGDLKGQFAPKHELLLFATKGRHILTFAEGRDNDIWEMPVLFSGRTRKHPNEKPVSWYLRPLQYSGHSDTLVCDPFMGSGTCAEASAMLGFDFIGCDIDRNYFDVAVNRLRTLEQ